MKQQYLSLFVFLGISLVSLVCRGQESAEIERLNSIIDSLESELERCQNAMPNLLLKLSELEPSYRKEEVYSYEELKGKLIQEIKNSSETDYTTGLEVIERVDSFSTFVDALMDGLVRESGGRDERGSPNNRGDRQVVQRIMIDEGRGDVLDAEILKLRSDLINLLSDDFDENMLVIGPNDIPENYDSWSQYTFRGMPLAAVLPLLNQLKANAKTSAINILKWIALTRR